eukprot:gnl/MRDRNA2_/MRDRNA2_368764_c0_seq1.p1 gnl/MRDRNA2_/MRDRNA2_368764_c0~~gnl/MRDRNA2_/MRDRNA2_368764_c0_seq1.p1  ORF type:complete len:152 (-),score=8.07 gnl/MRDRNA2_/MRDRNA2_368764_c0_seq1:2-457(-)
MQLCAALINGGCIDGYKWPTFANAHAMQPNMGSFQVQEFHKLMYCSAAVANPVKRGESDRDISAKAHIELATSFFPKSCTFCSAAFAKASNSNVSPSPAFANAHAALATSCALQVSNLYTWFSFFAAKRNSGTSLWFAFANAHTVLIRFML